MRTYHFVLETIFMLTTIVLVLELVTFGEWGYLLAIWWAFLGILQISHSFIVGLRYWADPAIRRSIALYWKLVLINFGILFLTIISLPAVSNSGMDSAAELLRSFYFATIVIFPGLLALFLWYITYRHQRKKEMNVLANTE